MPELRPLEEFVCDECGQIIEDVADGYVVWRTEDECDCDFKIIHKVSCDDESHPSSDSLEEFVGSRGLIRLTGYFSPGPLILNSQGSIRSGLPKSMDEFTDFFRRLHVPYYEEARMKFSNPELQAEYYDCNELLPYFEDALISICDSDFDERGR